ncbi:hypothetical protein BGZ90_006473 [Linnemannia elongata]|nr:hypothetical protein BGZ90_006473 [Linnemannia elongata]
MVHSSNDHQDIGVQVIRQANKNKTVRITTHQDPSSGKAIVIWSDVLRVFRDALYLQHGQRVLPFMKGSDFKDLDPPRIAAIPDEILDIVVEDSSPVDSAPRRPQDSTTEESYEKEDTVIDLSVRRNPVEGDELAAMENYTHIDRPNLLARGPQLYLDSLGNDTSSLLQLPFDHDSLSVADIQKLAEEGDAEAQYLTGCQYDVWQFDELGQNIISNGYAQAMEWYLKAAKQGHLEAQWAIGNLYENGLERPVDLNKAFEWYLKAAEGGYAPAQTILGKWYWDGSGGVPGSDESKAFEWYLKAAEGGDSLAQKQVGEFYFNGRGGVLKDELKAFVWFMKSAVQENSSAQLIVAELYCNGCEGVPRDYKKAKEWYLKAGRNGQHDAWDCLNGIDKQISFQELSPEQQQQELLRQKRERQQQEQLQQKVQHRREQQ